MANLRRSRWVTLVAFGVLASRGVAAQTVSLTATVRLPTQTPTVPAVVPAKPSQSLTPEGSLVITASALSFGGQLVGSTSSVQTVRLNAIEATTVTIGTPTGDFAITSPSSNTCQLDLGSSCAISLTFSPRQLGATTGFVSLAMTVKGSPAGTRAILLNGVGVAKCASLTSFSDGWFGSVGPVIVVVLLYFVGLVVVRWNMVALPTRSLLRAQIDAVKRRVEALPRPPNQTDVRAAQAMGLLNAAEGLVKDRGFPGLIPDCLFWTRGQELAGWGYVHEAEEQLVWALSAETVRAALERAETDLRQVGTPPALGLADRIHEALAAVPTLPLDPCRQVLQDVLSFLAPQLSTLAADVDAAIESASNVTTARCRELADKAVALLTPQTSTLAEQIHRVLASPTPTTADMLPLLQEAALFLNSQGALLSDTLKQASNATTPLTVEQWKPLLVQVRDYLRPQAERLAAEVTRALAAEPTQPPLDRWKALLSEALGVLYDRTDTNFANLISWHNKTMWLIGCGLLLIVALAAALEHGILFLVGATGGLLSRLSRALYRADVPTDYGASWTTLFLSPVVGALAGWSGILLMIIGVKFNVLGSAFSVDWCNPYSAVALGVAFLLGFSERAFDGILTQLETKVQPQVGAPQLGQPGPPTSLGIVSASGLPTGKVDEIYDQMLAATGGQPPYKWTVLSGPLPDGLALDPTGRISGKPKVAGPAKFTLQVADAASLTKAQEFSIVVGSRT